MAAQGVLLSGEVFLAWEEKKDPDATKDFYFDLTKYLKGDTITSINSVTPETGSSIIVGNGGNGAPAPYTDGSKIKLWFMSGVAGNWEIHVRFTTAAGVVDDITRILQVAET